MTRKLAGAAVAALLVTLPLLAEAQTAQPAAKALPDTRDTNLRAYVELLRADVRAQKVAILTELMGLTDTEDQAFWPIYREYDAELSALNDERIANIQDYAAHVDSLTEVVADKLAATAFDISRRRAAVLEKYCARVKSSLSAKAALRFLQLEHQMLLLVDLQIAAGLPIAQ